MNPNEIFPGPPPKQGPATTQQVFAALFQGGKEQARIEEQFAKDMMLSYNYTTQDECIAMKLPSKMHWRYRDMIDL